MPHGSLNSPHKGGAGDLFLPYPPQVPFDVAGYPVAPPNLQLEQVHVYVRHGERTPVGIRLAGPPANIPEHWMMCRTARRFKAAVTGLANANKDMGEVLQTRKVVERRDGRAADGECLLGELTDTGRQSTFSFGQGLRRLYIERLGFLPDTMRDSKAVYFRTTNFPRTTESLQQIVHGLYPTSKCHPAEIPPILIRNGKDENLIGNTYGCKRLEVLLVSFAKAGAEAYNHTLEHLDPKLSKYLDGNPIRVDGKPRASGVLDTIRAATAHGLKVPAEFEDRAVIDLIERAVVTEWFAGYKTEEVRRLGMGPLLGDMMRKMQHKVEHGDKDPLKILLHSTHDTAIAGLRSTLDVFDEKWPAFTAAITFELFKQTDLANENKATTYTQAFLSFLGKTSSPQHYVRMRYQHKNLILPLCAGEGQHLEGHPEFCTLAAFRDRINELVPEDWDAECLPTGRP